MSKQISFLKQKVELAHIAFASNAKEGDDGTIPVKLKFKASENTSWLAHFHPRLGSAFYEVDEDNADLVGMEKVLTKRIFGDMIDSVGIKKKLDGATGRITHGIGSTIDIDLATVSGFKVSFLEGGTTVTTFFVTARFPSRDIKTLSELMEGDVELDLGMSQAELEMGGGDA